MWILEVYLIFSDVSEAAPVLRGEYSMADNAEQEALSIIKNGTMVSMYNGGLCTYYPAHKIDRVIVRRSDGQTEDDWGHE